MSAKIRLLIIDPQKDFCDGPCNGALAVQGAYDDLIRLAHLVDTVGSHLYDIDVTLDSHHLIDIAHPGWWVNARGKNPPPYTEITARDIELGVWTTRDPKLRARCLDYVRKLESSGKYKLFIWPPHCLIGSAGHAVHPELFDSLLRWEAKEVGFVNYVTKGSNPFTEHYSAVAAEVPDPEDPSTILNVDLIDKLRDSDMILIAGEALSHCVRSTVLDIADNIGAEHVRKFVLLSDCSSSVPQPPGGPDFPAMGRQFVADMMARGMRSVTSTDFINELNANQRVQP